MEGKIIFWCTTGFLLGILCGTLYLLPVEIIALVLYCSVLYGAVGIVKRNTLIILVSVLLISVVVGIVRAELVPQTLPSVFRSYGSAKESFVGEVSSDPDIRSTDQQVTVRVSLKNSETKILLFLPLTKNYTYGERIHIRGVLKKPLPFATENNRVFRYDHYLAKRGIFATMSFASVYEINPPRGLQSYVVNLLYGAKHLFVSGLQRSLPSPYAALATGLLTGDQHQITDVVLQVLATSGLVWVVVLSGYHVMVIAEAVLWILAWLPEKIRIGIAIVCVMAVVFATGASAPSLRGGIMAGIALSARGSCRTYSSLRALAITVIGVLLWNPLLLAYDSGFQLSILVTPALILGTPILSSRLLWIGNHYVREIISVSVIAQLAVLPLLLWQDGNLELWAILANVFVMPLVPISMLCAVIAGFSGMFLPLYAKCIGWPAHMILYLILVVGEYTTRLPYAHATVPPFSFAYVPILYGVLAACVVRLKRKK